MPREEGGRGREKRRKGRWGLGQGRSLWTLSQKWGDVCARGQQRLAGLFKCGCVSQGKLIHTGPCAPVTRECLPVSEGVCDLTVCVCVYLWCHVGGSEVEKA